MRKLFLNVLAAIVIISCGKESPRTISDFNFGWKFALTDDTVCYRADYDDSGWRDFHLPHDWSIEGSFSSENPSTVNGGALPGGIGWYRKHFTPSQNGDRCFLEFDGIHMNSTLYVNGRKVGNRPYGYSSFSYEITDFLIPGENTVAVCVDNGLQPNSRWYSGCGIYRNVRIVTTGVCHVAYNGLFITTPAVSDENAAIHVEAEVVDMPEDATLEYSLLDRGGKCVAESKTKDLLLQNPCLWDTENPCLYTLVATVRQGGKILDRYTQQFGIRSFSFDRDKGFFLNNRYLKIKGVCLHHDMGCIGSAVHPRALERELSAMKEMGVNAIRTSHNPPAPELLDLCDKMGLLVIDEAFDVWKKHKRPYDYALYFDSWHEQDLRDFIKRDRNHPSVIMWSIGNEVLEQWETDGYAEQDLEYLCEYAKSGDENPSILLSRHLAAIVREMDDTRYVTAGCNDVSKNNNIYVSGAVDVIGANYQTARYDSLRVWFPDKILLGSETVSAFNSRGVYTEESHQQTAYDTNHAGWGNTAEDGWITVRDRDFIAGTFIWTGFDYLGEPTPFGWPSRSSYFGIVDLAGFPKDSYWMYKSEWTSDTVLHLLPHWNWKEGDSVDVWAYYNNASEVELLLNGKSLGRSSKEGNRLHAFWGKIPFEPGKLEVVSYENGKEVARDCRITSEDPVAIRLEPDRTTIKADGYDLSYVTVTAIDTDGNEVPTANGELNFSVTGEGELFGIDNGNPIDTLCMKGDTKPLFNGKALAVIRSLKDKPGTATLSVKGYGQDFSVQITSLKELR